MVSSPTASTVDGTNRSTYAGTAVARDLAGPGGLELDTWSDPGEQAALGLVAARSHGARILDVGVGGGRTTTLLRLVSDRYVGIDYTPDLVDACRRRHPDADIRHGDARSLVGFDDGCVDLAVFSYNGLDSMGHDDRALALRELARVLRPGGLLQFSTLNLDGPCFRATPLRQAGSQLVHTWSPIHRLAMRVLRIARAPLSIPRAVRNRRRLAGFTVTGDGWAMAPMEAYDFALLAHYVTLPHARRELAAAGFDLEVAFDAEFGRVVDESSGLADVRYFQLVARRA